MTATLVFLIGDALRRSLQKATITPRVGFLTYAEIRVLRQAVVVNGVREHPRVVQESCVAHADECSKVSSISPICYLAGIVVGMFGEDVLDVGEPISSKEAPTLLRLKRLQRRGSTLYRLPEHFRLVSSLDYVPEDKFDAT